MEEEKLPYVSPLDISVMRTKDLVKQMNSAITRVLVSQYPHLFPLQVNMVLFFLTRKVRFPMQTTAYQLPSLYENSIF